MAKRIPPLTDVQVRNARPRDAIYKLFDGDGLYLEVTPSGAKYWRFKYRRLNGRESRIAFGPYPDVSLTKAREKRAEARTHLASGIDPGEAKEASLREVRQQAGMTFEAVARDWHATMVTQWQPRTAKNILHRFEAGDPYPRMRAGRRPCRGSGLGVAGARRQARKEK